VIQSSSNTPHENVENLTSYQITSALEKRVYLERLHAQRASLTLTLPPATVGIPTLILSLGTADDGIVIDGAPHASTHQFSAGERVRLFGSLDGVRIVLDATVQGEIVWDHLPALSLSPPIELFRVQRREFFRIAAPTLKRPYVLAPVSNGSADTSSLPVLDISRGGICLEAPAHIQTHVGDAWEGCMLGLPESDEFPIALEIRSLSLQQSGNGKNHLRIGCKFINLHDVFGRRIEQYVMRLQRDQLARDRGWAQREPSKDVLLVRRRLS
jgi:flagellar brake protein